MNLSRFREENGGPLYSNLYGAKNCSTKSADGRMATGAARLARNRGRKNKTGLNLAGPLLEGMWISPSGASIRKRLRPGYWAGPSPARRVPEKINPTGFISSVCYSEHLCICFERIIVTTIISKSGIVVRRTTQRTAHIDSEPHNETLGAAGGPSM
jgi:hypothetical protein